MNLKEIRERFAFTQEQMVGVLKGICPKMDVSLLSKIENGVCEPTSEVKEYAEKVLASSYKEDKEYEMDNLPSDIQSLLYQPIYRQIYESVINASRQHPVTKQELVDRTGLNEREVRKLITELRNAGLPIIATSGHYGYWIASSNQEQRMLINEYKHRAYKLLKTASALENSNVGQIEIW